RRWDRVPPRIVEYFDAFSLSGDPARATIHDAYFQHIDKWALWGTGFDGDANFLSATPGVYRNVHNTFLKAWVEMGLVGAAILCAIALALIVYVIRAPSTSTARAVLAPIAAFSLTLGGLERASVTWFAIALACAVAYAAREGVAVASLPVARRGRSVRRRRTGVWTIHEG